MTAQLPPDPPLTLTRRRVLVIIGALMLGMILASLDQAVVATALPTIAGDLHDLAWVVTAYILATTVSTPLWGKLGYIHAFAASLHAVFLVAVPIAAVAFALTWLLKEVPLRKTSQDCRPPAALAPTAVAPTQTGQP